jgi:hypothetical protein
VESKRRWLWKTAGFLTLYLAWTRALQLLTLTLITYYASATTSTPNTPINVNRMQEIQDLYQSSALYLACGTALGFLILMRALYPMTSLDSLRGLFSMSRVRGALIPGFFRGTGIALGFVVSFTLAGYYHFTGFLVQLDEPWIAWLGFAIKTSALILWIYSEEFLFRKRLLDLLEHRLPKEAAIVVCALAYSLVKAYQFDLGWLQFLSVLFVAALLSLQAAYKRDFGFGAGQWAGCLWVFHLLFGLPVFGVSYPGIFSVQYAGPTLDVDFSAKLTRWLTGGFGGPLSSLSFQLIVLLYLGAASSSRLARLRKFRLNPAGSRQ